MDVSNAKPVDILLVEDSPSDAELTVEALKAGKITNCLYRVEDGAEALAYLRRKGKYAAADRPDLILLDLNLPKMDGRDVLMELKNDVNLKGIPIIVLTTSNSDKDISDSYSLGANCYITKPVDFRKFVDVIKAIRQFWLTIVTLPPKA